MAVYHSLTHELIHKVVSYDQSTGEFTRVGKLGKKGRVGEKLGTIVNGGKYVRINIAGCPVLAHRLAWFMSFGEWPTEIDHIDRNGLNNSINNLREVSHSENLFNRGRAKAYAANGVNVRKNGLWRAYISSGGVNVHLGNFKTQKDAEQARKIAEVKTFPRIAYSP